MCGITGWVRRRNLVSRDGLQTMVESLHHRGPDNTGVKIVEMSNGFSIGLGHARLSIIDLSEHANQPMTLGKLTVVFNGEIYNFKEIRAELEALGHHFALNSDTEVILHAFSEWRTDCVSHFIGMFAFSVFDQERDELYLFRDRAGVKPLYYGEGRESFFWGSELKSIYSCPDFSPELDMVALGQYFKLGYIPAPLSIYKGVKKLPPAHYLKLSLRQWTLEIKQYWNVWDFYKMPKYDISYGEAKERLDSLLRSACSYRMVADVPVGVFLSGGYDSVGVTSILQNVSGGVKTFTIGFEEGNNEAPAARAVANYLGTTHTEYICTPKEAQELIPLLPYYYDEPFSDSSAIPTMLVSKVARKNVTVALSADAGDEVFSGYNAYDHFASFVGLGKKCPAAFRKIVGSGGQFLGKWSPKLNKVGNMLYAYGREKNVFRAYETLQSLPMGDFNRFFSLPYASNSEEEVLNLKEIEVAQAMDYLGYLPGDILTKVDRATMSVSLEGREPLVDHRLLEFAARLPLSYKYSGSVKKRIFKDVVHRYIPKELMDRPKSGFSLPINQWLRRDLRSFFEDSFSERELSKSGVLNVREVCLLKQQFLKYRRNDSLVWRILQFQMWGKEWKIF